MRWAEEWASVRWCSVVPSQKGDDSCLLADVFVLNERSNDAITAHSELVPQTNLNLAPITSVSILHSLSFPTRLCDGWFGLLQSVH